MLHSTIQSRPKYICFCPWQVKILKKEFTLLSETAHEVSWSDSQVDNVQMSKVNIILLLSAIVIHISGLFFGGVGLEADMGISTVLFLCHYHQ